MPTTKYKPLSIRYPNLDKKNGTSALNLHVHTKAESSFNDTDWKFIGKFTAQWQNILGLFYSCFEMWKNNSKANYRMDDSRMKSKGLKENWITIDWTLFHYLIYFRQGNQKWWILSYYKDTKIRWGYNGKINTCLGWIQKHDISKGKWKCFKFNLRFSQAWPTRSMNRMKNKMKGGRHKKFYVLNSYCE